MPKSKTSTSSKNNRDTLPERFESYNDADYAAARLLNNACNVRPFILKDTGVTDYRIEDWKRQGYIERIDSAKGAYWRTTEEGRKTFSLLAGTDPYVSNSLRHDSKLAIVIESKSITEQESWVTEKALQDMAAAAQEKMERYAEEHNLTMKDFSSCDGGYISDVTGELVMCEVVTRFYTDEMIERKINFANAMGSQYEQHEA